MELLAQIGVTPDEVVPQHIDETQRAGETPRQLVVRLARGKAAAAARAGAFVLAADTAVAVGRRILGKPTDDAQSRRYLKLLSGRPHRVLTAVAAVAPDGRTGLRLSESRLKFKRLTAREIAAYVESGEGRDKAGGYAVQGRAGAFVVMLQGSYSGVMGLPLHETASLLDGLGWRR